MLQVGEKAVSVVTFGNSIIIVGDRGTVIRGVYHQVDDDFQFERIADLEYRR